MPTAVRRLRLALALAPVLTAGCAGGSPPDRVVRLVPLGWRAYRPAPSGRVLAIRYETNSTGPLAEVRVVETAGAVRIRLLKRITFIRGANGRLQSDQTADLVRTCTAVRLAAPVAGRRVLALVGRRARRAVRRESLPPGCPAPPRVRRDDP